MPTVPGPTRRQAESRSRSTLLQTLPISRHVHTGASIMKFTVGQRVISKPNKILGGYYGHVTEVDWQDPVFVIPFYHDELEAAD